MHRECAEEVIAIIHVGDDGGLNHHGKSRIIHLFN